MYFCHKLNFRLEEISPHVTYSGLNAEQKIKLTENVIFLNGKIDSNWNKACTHVTVSEITLTAKVLYALILGQPMVTLQFWDDYVTNVKCNSLPPDVKNYVPRFSEMVLQKNFSLEYLPERKTLFKNLTFVFATDQIKKTMDVLIKMAGKMCTFLYHTNDDNKQVQAIKIILSLLFETITS